MTGDEAAAIIARIASLELTLSWTTHARERAVARGFTNDDVMAILRSHVTEHAPRWNEKHSSYRISLRGSSLEGRPTRVILDLRQGGHHKLVTIMIAR